MRLTAESGLSVQQQSIIKWLRECVHFAEQHNPQLLLTGFPWSPQPTDRSRESAWRASLCRTLSRLERRGLITRIRGRKNERTVRVMLTSEGRAVSESINGG